jgi:hypothetical protein
MKKITKKEIKTTLDSAMNTVMEKLELPDTSKKTKRAISKVTKTLKKDLKEQAKKVSKKTKEVKVTKKGKEKKKPKNLPPVVNNQITKL